jgi:hypothetical protein
MRSFFMHRLAFALLAFLISTASATAQGVFPTVTADDLNGRSVTLPQGFPGETTIVFIAYKQNQQPLVDGWVRALGLDPSIGAEFVEIPVVGVGTRLIRPIVDNGMRSGIVDPALRARTITLYESPELVNTPLGFSGRGAIRVLVVRRNGQVLWSTSGGATAEGIAAVLAAYGA